MFLPLIRKERLTEQKMFLHKIVLNELFKLIVVTHNNYELTNKTTICCRNIEISNFILLVISKYKSRVEIVT